MAHEKTYLIEAVKGGSLIRLHNDFCSGWLCDNHTPPSGRYDRCGIVNLQSAAFLLPDEAALATAVAFVESKGYRRETVVPNPEPTELRQFLAMLERAGIGHGTRNDFNPPGTGVQVEHEDCHQTITDWWFDESGRLHSVVICE